jgi:putative ABC transport system ATP-binding protein
MATTLQIEDLGKQLHPPDGHWLFREMNASIHEPTVISILGRSGQGKSTLLRILGHLTTPSSGRILLDGKDSSQWTPEAWRMTVSYVAQQPVMLPGSVEDNLRIASFLHQRVFDLKQARQWMEQIGLEHLDWAKPAQQLSGGEKQRLALIRTLLLQPAILLLDEVTSSLDAGSKQAAEGLLRDLHSRTGTSILWVTHDQEEARTTSDRIWFMANGRLLEDTDRHTFFESPKSEEARMFLHTGHAVAETVEGLR